MNEGLLAPVTIEIPKGSLLSPEFVDDPLQCPGVAGGNVEISQRVVDLIFLAFGQVACSLGTMNNLTFGNDHFSHYETIGGGSGAAIGQDGESAVQVHMTNTAITDPEVLEARFPVRLLAFRKRAGSGGAGSWPGGEGIEREYLFEEAVTISFLLNAVPLVRKAYQVVYVACPASNFLFVKMEKKLNFNPLIPSIYSPEIA